MFFFNFTNSWGFVSIHKLHDNYKCKHRGNKFSKKKFVMTSDQTKSVSDVYFQRQISIDPLDQVLSIDQKLECDVGCVVWDAALVLAKYLEFKSKQLGLSSANVVELGAGTGFCGLMAATLGSNVIISDLSYCLDIMDRNVENNRHLVEDRVLVKEFDWNSTDPQKQKYFDWNLDSINLILISDCIYYEKSVEPLFETILWLSSKGAKILLSFEDREDKQLLIHQFFKLMETKFKSNEICFNDLHPDYRSSDLHLFEFKQII